MKLKLLLLMFIFSGHFAWADPITPQTAQLVAEHFISGKLSKQLYLKQLLPPNSNFQNQNYYIFNATDGTAFVIVSADDRFEPVLAYSTENNFSFENAGENTLNWFEGLDMEIQYGIDFNLPADAEILGRWKAYIHNNYVDSRSTTSVSPLLQSKWGQQAPYNGFCPTYSGQKALVGCVATAMAQIMRFWKYPSKGNGSYSYNHSTFGTLTAYFGTTTYDWNSMPLVNAANTTNTELARINYHCGVSVKMNYGLNSSGAYTHKSDVGTGQPCAERAFIDYFKYDPSLVGRLKSSYTNMAWENLLRAELDAGRPMLYRGYSTTGGHAFVCDGYNGSYFHFDWGWNGSYNNGNYLLTAMNPGGGNGYTSNQGALFGIKPIGNVGCTIPSGLSTSNISSTSAQLNWTPVIGATQYFVQAKLSSSSNWTITGYVTTASAQVSGLSAGSTYQWQVKTVCGSTSTNFSGTSTFATSSAAPSNDMICNATNLTASNYCSYVNGSLIGATPSSSGTTCSTASPYDVWYKCLIPSSGRVTFRTTAGTLTDAIMAIYYSTCSNPIYVTCEDDNDDGNDSTMPVIGISGSPNTQLWIRVWGYNNTSGTFKICALNYSSADFNPETQFVQIPDKTAKGITFEQAEISDWQEPIPLDKTAKDKPNDLFNDGFNSEYAKLMVAPNPANDLFTLKYLNTNSEEVQIYVFNAIGNMVYSANKSYADQQESISVKNWPSGLYTVRILMGEHSETAKLVIQH